MSAPDWQPVLDILAYKTIGGTRYFEIKWADGLPNSWEPEVHLGEDLNELKESVVNRSVD